VGAFSCFLSATLSDDMVVSPEFFFVF